MKRFDIIDKNELKSVILSTKADFFNIEKEICDKIFFYEESIIKYILKHDYNFLTNNEQMFLQGEAKKKIDNKREVIKKSINKKLSDYIKCEKSINIKGFLTFRLKEYIKNIEDFILISVNDFIVKNEYNDLIEGLTMYAELQSPLIDLIKISQMNDCIIMTDLNGKEFFSLTGYDDILLDVLMTLSPREILVIDSEKFKNKELLNTIMKIYNNRVKLIN